MCLSCNSQRETCFYGEQEHDWIEGRVLSLVELLSINLKLRNECVDWMQIRREFDMFSFNFKGRRIKLEIKRSIYSKEKSYFNLLSLFSHSRINQTRSQINFDHITNKQRAVNVTIVMEFHFVSSYSLVEFEFKLKEKGNFFECEMWAHV